MLFKVAIIEDNNSTVRSLTSTIDWRALGCEVIGVAYDGESGKNLVVTMTPDIVLTDIRMPKRDGLTMIQEVNQFIPESKIIIITGYDQFSYANQAIKLSVFDYILKPIDNQEIERSVRRAVACLQTQKKQGAILNQAAEQIRRARLISILINECQTEPAYMEIPGQINPDFEKFYVLAMRSLDEKTFPNALLNHLDMIMERSGINATTLVLYDVGVVYVNYDGESENWQRDSSILSNLISSQMLHEVHIGVSTLHESGSGIRAAYLQARQALWAISLHKPTNSENTLWFHQISNIGVPISAVNRGIDDLIDKAEISEASAIEATEVLLRLSGEQYSNLRTMVSLYAFALIRKFDKCSSEKIDSALTRLWFVTDEENTRACLINLHMTLKGELENRRIGTYSLLTKSALGYIKLHAIEHIRLGEVAENLCISPNYLSALIRKETGATFRSHVLEAKMDVACRLLADPRILVDEIARIVGYGNYISFYSVFKRLKNMTPTDYRNKLAES